MEGILMLIRSTNERTDFKFFYMSFCEQSQWIFDFLCVSCSRLSLHKTNLELFVKWCAAIQTQFEYFNASKLHNFHSFPLPLASNYSLFHRVRFWHYFWCNFSPIIASILSMKKTWLEVMKKHRFWRIIAMEESELMLAQVEREKNSRFSENWS